MATITKTTASTDAVNDLAEAVSNDGVFTLPANAGSVSEEVVGSESAMHAINEPDAASITWADNTD